MNTFIALLRGINVGGHNKLPMANLRETLSKKGFKNVKTYIQSGNVIFQSSIKDRRHLEQIIQDTILEGFGFKVPVIVKTPENLQQIFNDCPFSEEKKQKSYFSIFQSTPDKELVKETSKISYPNEEFVITEQCIYLFVEAGYGNAKFNNNSFEKKLNTKATARNYKTMVKLLSLSAEID